MVMGLWMLICLSLATYAVPGSLDTTFGTGGLYLDALTNHPSYALAPVDAEESPEGSILVVGDYYSSTFSVGTVKVLLRRYTRNGPVDQEFGYDGFAVSSIFPSGPVEVYGSGRSVAVQPDGSIVVAGLTYASSDSTDTRFTLWRFITQGQLDTTFADEGKLVMFPLDKGRAESVSISQGKIVVAGYFSQGNGTFTTIARLNLDGTFDTSFGSGGIKIVGNGYTGSSYNGMFSVFGPRALTGQSGSGDIYLAGHYYNGSHHLAVAKYDQFGSLVLNFGNGGIAMTPVGLTNGPCSISNPNLTQFRSVLLYPDGRVGAAGITGDLANPFFLSYALGRFDSAGNPDAGFGQNGLNVGTCVQNAIEIDSAALLSDGKIAYLYPVDDLSKQALFRVNVDGTPDTSFAPPNMDFGRVQYLLRQGTYKLIRVGTYLPSRTSLGRIKLARYLP
jgi:uncharacterized delta-60 repeat protein